MVNEFFFFLQIFFVIGFSILAARIGPLALTSLISLEGVLANLFVVKQMDLFGLTVTCGDCLAVGSILGLNLLQEHFGKDIAKRMVNISFTILIFFVFLSQIHLFYIPASVDKTQKSFEAVLCSAPRIVIASAVVYYFVQKLDVALFGWLNKLFNGRFFFLRMGISLISTQFVDTVLFSFLGLYGLVSSIFDCIAISFIVKCLIIACSAPLAGLSHRFMKKKEAFDEFSL